MQTRRNSFERQDAAARAVGAPVRFVEVALPSPLTEVRTEGYTLVWPSGMSLRVPRGFDLEELTLLFELLREEKGGEEE